MKKRFKSFLRNISHMRRQTRKLSVLHDPKHLFSRYRAVIIKNIRITRFRTNLFDRSFQIMIQLRIRENIKYARIRSDLFDHFPCFLFFTPQDDIRIILIRHITPAFLDNKLQRFRRRFTGQKLLDDCIREQGDFQRTYTCDCVSIFCIPQF